MSRLWDKGEAVDDLILRFCVGDDPKWDARLVPYDVAASIAHADMLAAQGWLTEADVVAIRDGLNDLAASHARGEWEIAVEQEDVHTALEERLVAAIGDAGERVHLGRSRNDQVLVAVRLYLRDAVDALAEGAESVADALDALVASQGDVVLPGYTHLQRAMPSSVALWAGAYASELRDDAAGLRACRRRLGRNPLGSAAGYGPPAGLSLDREHTTRALGFNEVHGPVTAVQLSRGKAEAEVLFQLSLVLRDCARMAADLCLFSTAEFGFVRLPAEMTTGSSIMPQKRNPDVFELIRGRAAAGVSRVVEVMGIAQGQPSGYHRELQLIKGPLFSGIDESMDVLRVLAHAVPGIRFVPSATEAAMDPSLHATAEAVALVRDEGITFREAYRRIGPKYTRET